MCSVSVSQKILSQQGVTLYCSTLTVGIWCTALGKVCYKLNYAIQAFSTPRVYFAACARLSGCLVRFCNRFIRARKDTGTE